VRAGDPTLAPQVESELATLGLAGSVATPAALVIGNTVTVADSGAIQGDYGFFGAVCAFVTVTSVTNDNGDQCDREYFLWQFGLRFSPSVYWNLASSYSPGVVIVH
jgi:hypothetical protein